MLFNPTQSEVRGFFCDAWQKACAAHPLTPLEAIVVDWIRLHPEYHGLLADREAALLAEFAPQAGRENPFLHLSMHLAIAEQLQIDQPPGIRAAAEALTHRLDDAHAAAHAMMECLGRTVWTAQRSGRALDGEAYLECLRKAAT